MSEEIRTEEIEVTEAVETEDVKEGLGPMEYGVILGIATAGVAIFEGGKWVWKKTSGPRSKIKAKLSGIGKKKDIPEETNDQPDQEGSPEEVAEKTDAKKSEAKGKFKK